MKSFLSPATRRYRCIACLLSTASLTTSSGAFAFGSGTGNFVVTVDDTEALSGSGQSVTVSRRNLWVGNYGTGVLTISNGAKVSGQQYNYIAVNRGTNGTVTVDGAGSELTSSDNTIAGYGGTGTLTISNGGKVNAGGGGLGAYSYATGTATVDGAGSEWNNSGTMAVGNGGVGTLTISNGGKVTNSGGAIGVAAGSVGTVTVTGTASTWANSGSLTVGDAGKGSLTIANGGTVSAGGGTGTVTLASQRGSTGTLNIGGAAGTAATAAGTLNAATVAFGSGTGTINFNHTSTTDAGYTFAPAITGNGTLNQIAGNTSLTGNSSGFAGTTNVTGGRLAIAGTLGGSSAKVDGGTVTVAGSGSTWANSGNLTVGDAGAGALAVSNGGKVSDTDGIVGGSGTGMVAVTGTGSSWTNSGSLTVGNAGAGTLAVSTGGKVTNSGGTIGVAAGSTGTVTVAGANSTWANSGSLTVGNSGTGALTISTGGKVTNSGGTIGVAAGSTGTVTVDGANSTWANSGSLTVGNAGAGTLTISNGGTVSAGGGTGTVTLASQRGSTGTLNIGSAAGAAPAAAGTLNAATVAFGSGTGTINFNHTSTADAGYTFASAISGNGTLNQIAGNTSLTGNSSSFTGTTNVTGGRLAVNGSLDHSAVTVSNGGILGGTGTVGSTVANSGGIVAPGNSVGTLKVAGNVSFNSGSTYQVQVQADGVSDRITATGTATIRGATLEIEALAGNYQPTTPYTILSANSVTGTFSTLTNKLAFLDASLSYDPKNIYLKLTRNDVAIGSVARTPNERATGAVIKVGSTPDNIYNGILSQTADGARHALDQLSGEVHASTKGMLVEDSHFVRDAANNRLRAAFGDAGVSSSALVLAYGNGGAKAGAPTAGRPIVWGSSFGSWGGTNSNGNAAGLNRTTGGFLVGADAPVFNNWRLGLITGYSHTDFTVKDRASSGKNDSYHLGLYGGTQWSLPGGALGFRTGLAYSSHYIDTSRSLAFGGFTDKLNGDYRASTAQAYGELAYRTDVGSFSFEPFNNLAYVNVHSGRFTETGGKAALVGASSNTGVTYNTLGLRASTTATSGKVQTTVRGQLGWRYAVGDVSPTSTLAFAGGSAFTSGGVPIARNAAVIAAGIDINPSPSTTLALSYTGQLATGARQQSVIANFGMKF
ncbi:hypothetical protein R69746_07987 [Paraburkholderia aspalathi]|nr:hypothetical protein R69746_07987 [Paraburkholderia aspalathi]